MYRFLILAVACIAMVACATPAEAGRGRSRSVQVNVNRQGVFGQRQNVLFVPAAGFGHVNQSFGFGIQGLNGGCQHNGGTVLFFR